jgi:ADP-ribose pyrophosphatase YjhB (NUDIX family)
MTNPFPKYTPGDLDDHHAIGALVRNENGDYLMFFHKKFAFWTIPIGKAELGETPYQGMCTELKEECDIEIIKASEFATAPYEYMRHGKLVKVQLHLYDVHEYKGTPKNGEPHKHPEMKYLSIDAIRELDDISDGTKLFLEQY